MSTSATLEHGDPQIEVDLMLELKMTVQKLKKALPRFGKGIQIEMGAVNNRLLGCGSVTHQLVGEVNLLSLLCSSHVIATWPDSRVHFDFETYIRGICATCTTPASIGREPWETTMFRSRHTFMKQLKTPNVEGVLLDPTLKFIFMLCRYERLLNRSKASKTRGQVKNFQFDNFDQLSQTMARFSVVSDQLLVEIEPCIDRFVVPLLHLSCQPTPQDCSKLVSYVARAAKVCEHHAHENSLRSASQLAIDMRELQSDWKAFRVYRKKMLKYEKRRQKRAQLCIEQAQIAAQLLAPLENEKPIKIEPSEDTKPFYNLELEAGDIDERTSFVKQEVHTQCVVTPSQAPTIKTETMQHTSIGTKRRAEEPEEGLIAVKKERLED